MSGLTLVIGNKNYSSWSLRPWLALRNAGIPFDERLLLLFDENWREAIAAVSPSGRVPVLLHGERTIWETLAIIEYANELFPEAGLGPEDRDARTTARAVANEMHAGFNAVCTHMPMNLRRSDLKGKGRGPGVDDDIARICEIWRDCRGRYGAGGDFLDGEPDRRPRCPTALLRPTSAQVSTYPWWTLTARPPPSAKSPPSSEKATGGLRRRLTFHPWGGSQHSEQVACPNKIDATW